MQVSGTIDPPAAGPELTSKSAQPSGKTTVAALASSHHSHSMLLADNPLHDLST